MSTYVSVWDRNAKLLTVSRNYKDFSSKLEKQGVPFHHRDIVMKTLSMKFTWDTVFFYNVRLQQGKNVTESCRNIVKTFFKDAVSDKMWSRYFKGLKQVVSTLVISHALRGHIWLKNDIIKIIMQEQCITF